MNNTKRFISKNSNLRIVLKHGIPPEPITGRLAVPGLSIKFEGGIVNISDEETINLMMAHSGFNSDFILVNEEETADPWKQQRRGNEPRHNLTELKYGHVEKTLTPKKPLDGMSIEKRMLFEKMVEDTAKKIAVPLAKEMLRKVMKEQEEENVSLPEDENLREAASPKVSEPLGKEIPIAGTADQVICKSCGYVAKNERALKTHQRFSAKCKQASSN